MEENKNALFYQLLNFYAIELYNECVVNQDSSNFWEKSNEYIFSEPVVSFKTALVAFHRSLTGDKDMYNYFVTMFVRAFAQPFTAQALDEFGKSFNNVTSDPIFGGAVDFTFSELSKSEQLMLFFSINRDQISLALDQKKQAALEAYKTRRTRK